MSKFSMKQKNAVLGTCCDIMISNQSAIHKEEEQSSYLVSKTNLARSNEFWISFSSTFGGSVSESLLVNSFWTTFLGSFKLTFFNDFSLQVSKTFWHVRLILLAASSIISDSSITPEDGRLEQIHDFNPGIEKSMNSCLRLSTSNQRDRNLDL
jgi:hypothetical protein